MAKQDFIQNESYWTHTIREIVKVESPGDYLVAGPLPLANSYIKSEGKRKPIILAWPRFTKNITYCVMFLGRKFNPFGCIGSETQTHVMNSIKLMLTKGLTNFEKKGSKCEHKSTLNNNNIIVYSLMRDSNVIG